MLFNRYFFIKNYNPTSLQVLQLLTVIEKLIQKKYRKLTELYCTYISFIMDEIKLISLKDLIQIIGLSKSTIHRRIRQGKFRHSLNLGGNCRRWRYCDFKNWETSLEVEM